MGSIDVKHKSRFFLDCSLVEVSLSRGITDNHSILVDRFHVLPGIFILVEGEVMAFAIWAWLITVDLPIVEQISIVVAIGAMLHLIVSVRSRNWIRNGEDGSIVSLLLVGLVSVPLMSFLVLLLIASSIVPSHCVVLDKFISNCIRSSNIQVRNITVTMIVEMSIVVSSIIYLINEMLSHQKTIRMVLSHS